VKREAVMSNRVAATDLIAAELKRIRQNVPGVRGSIAATSDGLLLAHDVHDMEPTQIAALVAALHAVAVRATLSTESGDFKDVITRASEGYLAVFAAGGTAIVAVLGTTGLNVAILNHQARSMIERVAEFSGDLARRASADPAHADPAHAETADVDGAFPLRRRRR
jgi:predicted regulator of Ras-like GTPase activity (Roadblock/LC7/MglB family)